MIPRGKKTATLWVQLIYCQAQYVEVVQYISMELLFSEYQNMNEELHSVCSEILTSLSGVIHTHTPLSF